MHRLLFSLINTFTIVSPSPLYFAKYLLLKKYILNKSKFALSAPWRHREGEELWLYSFLIPALAGDD
jgi:hypothetical protein